MTTVLRVSQLIFIFSFSFTCFSTNKKKANASLLHAMEWNSRQPGAILAAIRHGADIHLKTPVVQSKYPGENRSYGGSSVLHNAASWFPRECERFVDVLVAAKADVNAVDCNGQTPLLDAVFLQRNLRAVKALLKQKANVNHSDNKGASALELACYVAGESTTILETLLAAKASVNHQSRTVHGSALAVAASMHNLVYLQLLIDAKADLSQKSKPIQKIGKITLNF